MTAAGHLLTTYRIRKEGHEKGWVRYVAPFYEAVCALVDRLARLPADEGIQIEERGGDGVFIVARTGIEIARLPTFARANAA
jgi:hypothetical protein